MNKTIRTTRAIAVFAGLTLAFLLFDLMIEGMFNDARIMRFNTWNIAGWLLFIIYWIANIAFSAWAAISVYHKDYV